MEIKSLIGILNRPWFIEPSSAQQYSEYAATLFRTGSVPVFDPRQSYSTWSGDDRGPVFRVNENAAIDNVGVVQVIRINYAIAKYDICGNPGTQSVQQIIQSANVDPSIRSIVLWFDSPGGQVDGTEALANVIKASSKPIITYCDYMLCSAAYWLGSSAMEIVVHGANAGLNAVIGSIGTMAYWEDKSGVYEKEGIKVHTVFATQSKDKWAKNFKINSGSEDAYTELIEELDGLNSTFTSAVKINRAGKLLLDKEDVLTGKTYNANDSLQYGLIDSIGDFEYAVKRSLHLSKQSATQEIQKTNIMKFPKTMSAANSDKEFDVLNEGIWITEDQLNSVEHMLIATESASTEALQILTTNSAEISRLVSENNRLTAENSTLQTEVIKLGKQPATSSETIIDEDPSKVGQTQTFAHNEWADQMLGYK